MKPPRTNWTPYLACDAVEFSPEAYTEEDRLAAMQYLIDTKLAWSLQGSYGRAAAALIESGECHA
jgi:hypothetical protein